MRNFFLFLLLIGLLAAGWRYRGVLTGESAPAELKLPFIAESTPPTPPPPTPHPAHEAQTAVLKAYPALGLPDSPFNRTFKEMHAEAKRNNPQLLADPDWPITLAERTAIALGGGPQPIPGRTPPPRPSGLKGSALDQKPAH
jgi:hypothetical protein